VRFLGALHAKLHDADTVTVLPAVAGGSGPDR
jgi:molybdopterin converting factor small subunit